MKEVTTHLECTRTCFMCRNVLPEWIEVIENKRHLLSFSKGEYIFREGEKVEGIYFILKGKVKIDTSWTEGKNLILRLAGDGDILGHRGYGIDNSYPINAIALEESTVCFITNDLFMTLIKTNYQFHEKLTFFFASELKRSEKQMKHVACMPVKNRVIESLIMNIEAFGLTSDHWLTYPLTRKDLASIAGTTYESVIRTLNQLAASGCIQLKRKQIQILDEQKLVALCKAEAD